MANLLDVDNPNVASAAGPYKVTFFKLPPSPPLTATALAHPKFINMPSAAGLLFKKLRGKKTPLACFDTLELEIAVFFLYCATQRVQQTLTRPLWETASKVILL